MVDLGICSQLQLAKLQRATLTDPKLPALALQAQSLCLYLQADVCESQASKDSSREGAAGSAGAHQCAAAAGHSTSTGRASLTAVISHHLYSSFTCHCCQP